MAGCASKIPETRIIERNGITAFVSTDDHKVAYIKSHGNLDRVCASWESDAVATDETGISFGLSSATGQSENIGEVSGRGELGLGGRSPVVLMSREFLYRACELSNNLNSSPQTTIEIYKMFLKSLENIASSPPNNRTLSVSSSLPSYQFMSDSNTNKGEDDEDEKEDEDDEDDEEDEEDEEDADNK